MKIIKAYTQMGVYTEEITYNELGIIIKGKTFYPWCKVKSCIIEEIKSPVEEIKKRGRRKAVEKKAIKTFK